jgi:hypothetical protein
VCGSPWREDVVEEAVVDLPEERPDLPSRVKLGRVERSLSVNPKSVYNRERKRMAKAGLARRTYVRLTQDQVDEMRRLYDEGMSVADVAREVGVNYDAARKQLRGRWR